ncbi:hypothetical protein TL16_g11097 [Triparma laevis f. inornata]|nr:hypothetical protein TL16_g11097 [Triparma laevis f. inornata]GMI17472.1 hypothetical protein TrLO_g6013 [Triparma laevis f. longispina]
MDINYTSLLIVLLPLLIISTWELLLIYLPCSLGRLFSKTMKMFLGDTAPVVDVKSFGVKFWVRRRKIHALVTVEGFGFGNPPDFPHKYFAAAEELSIHVAVSFKDLMSVFWHTWSFLRLGKSPLPMSPALLSCPTKFPWDPTAQEKNSKFRVHWRDYYVGIVHVYHLVIIGSMCNFEIGPGGELSVNGIERTLAESYCRKTWRRQNIPESKRPNRLSVSIVKARHLRLVKRKNSAKRGDPFVSVRAREQECFTKVLMSESNPRWDESFDLHVKDPSTVLTVNVWDEDAFTSPLIGRWVMTTRFLVGNPHNCNHIKGDFKVTRRWDGNKPGTRIEGWFPLVDEDYKNMGKVGEIYMVIEWYHDAEFDRGYKPSPRPDAMGQLMLNAEENDYRGNDPDGDLLAWKAFPLLFNIRMVVIHEVAFFIKDIFAGYKGFKSMDIKNAIRMPHIYLSQSQLEPNDNFPGQTLWGALNVIIMGGAVPQCLANSEFRNSVAWSVLSGTLRGFGQANKWKRRRDILSRTGENSAGNETFTQKLNRKWQLMTKGDKFLTKQVTAEDEDANKEVTLVGHLEKTSKPPHIPNVFRNWHTVKCEIKGSTLYYYPFMEDKEVIHGTARHVKLHTLQFSELIEDGTELKITSFDARAPKRYFRIPTSLPELTKNEPNLPVWCEKFKQAGAENEVKRNKEAFGSQHENLFDVGSSPEQERDTDLSGYEVEDDKFDLDGGVSSDGPDMQDESLDRKFRKSDPFPFKKFASNRGKKKKVMVEDQSTRRR